MRKRRVLSCVLSAFIICSITCGPTSVSATYNTLEDMEIDPWGDLEDIQGFEPPTPELAPDDFEPVTMFPDVSTFDLNNQNYWIVSNSESLTLDYYRYGSSTRYGQSMDSSALQFPPTTELFILDSVEFTSTKIDRFNFDLPNSLYIQMLSNTQYLKGDYTLSGETVAYLASYFGSSEDVPLYENKIYPSSMEVFTGTTVLATFDIVDGKFVSDLDLTLSQDIQNIGYRFNFDAVTNDYVYLDPEIVGFLGFLFYCDDGLTLLEYEDPSLGLLEGIIEWLKSIRDGILELPQNIANFILEGLQGLFIPDQEELTGLMDKYDVLFEERLGFIYQMFSFVVDSFTTWIETMKSAQDYSFTFPGISFPYDGGIIEIVPEQEVSLDNAVMDVLRPVLGTIVSIVCVLAFTNTCFDLVIALMSGQSYMEFIGRKREELDV